MNSAYCNLVVRSVEIAFIALRLDPVKHLCSVKVKHNHGHFAYYEFMRLFSQDSCYKHFLSLTEDHTLVSSLAY